MKDIQSGNFFEGGPAPEDQEGAPKKKDKFDINTDYSNINFDVRKFEKELEAEPNFETYQVKQISLFKEAFNPKADVVYYPCSEFDVSVSEVFPNSRVIYADINYEVFDALKDKGLEAHHASALEFNPGNVDILFLFNPQIDPGIPASFVISGGYVMCNDYHATAQKLGRNQEFQIVGVMKRDENGTLQLIKEDLIDYITLVEDIDLNDAIKAFETERKKSAEFFIFKKI